GGSHDARAIAGKHAIGRTAFGRIKRGAALFDRALEIAQDRQLVVGALALRLYLRNARGKFLLLSHGGGKLALQRRRKTTRFGIKFALGAVEFRLGVDEIGMERPEA